MVFAIFLVLLSFAISFLCTAGLVALLCQGLKALGIFTIGAFAVEFSWPLVLVIWLVTIILKSALHVSVSN